MCQNYGDASNCPGPQTQSSLLVLASADVDTQAVQVPSVNAVQVHAVEPGQSAHIMPENDGQLVHAAGPVVFLYFPDAHGGHGPPSGPE